MGLFSLFLTLASTVVNGKLPRQTPYPTAAPPSTRWWRALAHTRLSDFRIFMTHSYAKRSGGPRQVHLMALRKSDPVEADFALALVALGEFDELTGPIMAGICPREAQTSTTATFG